MWKLNKGKRLNVYVAVFEEIWFGKGQRLHRPAFTQASDYLIPYIPEVQVTGNQELPKFLFSLGKGEGGG